MKTYKLWIEIEEYDDQAERAGEEPYRRASEPVELAELPTLEEADDFQNRIVEYSYTLLQAERGE